MTSLNGNKLVPIAPAMGISDSNNGGNNHIGNDSTAGTPSQKMSISPSQQLQSPPENQDTTTSLTSGTPVFQQHNQQNNQQHQALDQRAQSEEVAKEKSKRRKVDIACVYCRRSHMICDDSRPCQRCIKRNIGHLCHDEPVSTRQKKRYEAKQAKHGHQVSPANLEGVSTTSDFNNTQKTTTTTTTLFLNNNQSTMYNRNNDNHRNDNKESNGNDNDSITQKNGSSETIQNNGNNYNNPAVPNDSNPPPPLQQLTGNQTQNGSGNNLFLSQQPVFFSEHAGSEFSSLNEFLQMIDDPEFLISMNNDPILQNIDNSLLTHNNSTANLQQMGTNGNGVSNSLFGAPTPAPVSAPVSAQQQPHNSQFNDNGNLSFSPLFQSSTNLNQLNSGGNNYAQSPAQTQQLHDQLQQQSQQNPSQQASHPLGASASSGNRTAPTSSQGPQQPHAVPFVSDSARDKFFLTAADPTTDFSAEERLKQVINAKLEAGLLKPYNYAEGYARLQRYMDSHMNPSSRQRILKPLSVFRPAFRAIAKTLKDIDLILVEESFERMLLDYDRVFTSMAIPACLWRRTGEIYRGNKEFASLVEVSIDDLKNGKLTIYELMSEESSVNFWEKYGSIAFDKTQKAVLTSCKLKTKDGRKKKNCCFSFTIRRDRYNIPSCIVGNFIPISE
ncbi:hypothetical protein PACTADRAFT_51901 [Pachysolen tannophilus NRRL Y-2460]|uniref:Zn(2)-C6 fungal-type domain-containing protein n=1 Tax=Pachysolen tannophilus NRRL Y-2460 TaxID=669874 RepID=A0A1E4TNI5_PACTA|nr:hypothetical protein PACTADRAFT_51901 [Pachysolen tannophilus NRRL Y-2460]